MNLKIIKIKAPIHNSTQDLEKLQKMEGLLKLLSDLTSLGNLNYAGNLKNQAPPNSKRIRFESKNLDPLVFATKESVQHWINQSSLQIKVENN